MIKCVTTGLRTVANRKWCESDEADYNDASTTCV